MVRRIWLGIGWILIVWAAFTQESSITAENVERFLIGEGIKSFLVEYESGTTVSYHFYGEIYGGKPLSLMIMETNGFHTFIIGNWSVDQNGSLILEQLKMGNVEDLWSSDPFELEDFTLLQVFRPLVYSDEVGWQFPFPAPRDNEIIRTEVRIFQEWESFAHPLVLLEALETGIYRLEVLSESLGFE